MKTNSKKIFTTFVFFVITVALFAQKDVTQFLGIPVDGYKVEMIEKLKDKGFTINQYSNDVLDGEFNGTKVNILIVTNNNKVWRIAVTDEITNINTSNESNIKARYNNLLQQFNSNKKYIPVPDSTILKQSIREDEDISYELLIRKKSYQAVFYQQTAAYDSITTRINFLKNKQSLNDTDLKQLGELIANQMTELYKCFDKKVWINISQRSGKYAITIFYDNEYNKANGEDL